MSFAFASPRSLRFRALRAAVCPLTLAAALVAAAGVARLSAQVPGSLDPSFTAADTGFTFYTQVPEVVIDPSSMVGQPFLFAAGDKAGINTFVTDTGNFATFPATDTIPAGPFALADFGSAARIIYTAVPEIIPQEPGITPSILVGGQFGRSATQIRAGLTAQNIARIYPSGAIDGTFAPGTGANSFVTSIVPLTGGGMVLGGAFDAFNGQPRLHIVRLTSTGGIVPGNVFDPGLSFDAQVLSIAAQTVGNGTPDAPQFVVAGLFSVVNNVSHPKLARINFDGSVDASFRPSFDDRTTIVVCQPDGKILVGGDFSNVNGTPHKHVVRLNYDGSVDSTFVASVTGTPSGFIDPPAVYVIKLLNDGSMYLGGNFTTVNGVTRDYLAHVDANGVLDPGFDPGKTIINAVQSLTVQSDGNVIVGETVSRANTNKKYQPSLIRLIGEAPVVTVGLTASKPTARVAGQVRGVFTLTRNNSVSNEEALTISVSLSGSAVYDKNYAAFDLPVDSASTAEKRIFTVTFPPGVTSLKLPVLPKTRTINPATFPGGRTVTLTLVDDSSQTATVTIKNN